MLQSTVLTTQRSQQNSATPSPVDPNTLASVEELDKYLDVFFDTNTALEQTIGIKTEPQYALSLASSINRIVFKCETVVFPNKLLLLPPIFHAYRWNDHVRQLWISATNQAAQYFSAKPNLSDAVLLLFLEAMTETPVAALRKFDARAQLLALRPYEQESAMALSRELAHYGWNDSARRAYH